MGEQPMSLPRFRWVALAVAAAMLTQPLFAGQAPPQTGAQQTGDPHIPEEQAAERQALGFLGYLDQGRYADSYAYTGMLIRTQLDRDGFSTQIERARAGTGALQSRELIDAGYTTTVSRAPEGQYVILHYHASFANRPDVVETVTLAFAKAYWWVSGYYIK
jgi:serine/threonine-protein kinase